MFVVWFLLLSFLNGFSVNLELSLCKHNSQPAYSEL